MYILRKLETFVSERRVFQDYLTNQIIDNTRFVENKKLDFMNEIGSRLLRKCDVGFPPSCF